MLDNNIPVLRMQPVHIFKTISVCREWPLHGHKPVISHQPPLRLLISQIISGNTFIMDKKRVAAPTVNRPVKTYESLCTILLVHGTLHNQDLMGIFSFFNLFCFLLHCCLFSLYFIKQYFKIVNTVSNAELKESLSL